MQEQKELFSFHGLAKSLQLPDDFAKGNTLVSLLGQERVIVENFREISSYTEEEVRLTGKKRKLCITGKNLKIDSYTKEEIEISGIIDRLEYQ